MVKKEKSTNKFNSKEKVLNYLIENKKPASIREVSKAVKTDYKNTYNIVKDLNKNNAIIKERIGNTNPIRINFILNQEILNTEYKRTQEFISKNSKFKPILQDILDLDYPFLIVLVFGSYPKNKNKKYSDIDLCIISDNKIKTKELIEKLNLIPMNLEIHEFTTKQFSSMINTQQENVAREITKYNIILFGRENYYSLISKWMKKE